MNNQPVSDPTKEDQSQNCLPKTIVKEEINVTIHGTHEVTNDEAEKKYLIDLKKYEEALEDVKKFRGELKDLFHKSQDTFEKQLSYISAGALALSVGFIKDIVHSLKDSSYKWMLIAGWGLLISTLLLNLISHILAGKYAKKGAKEAEDIDNTYNPMRIDNRAKRIERINWTTVATLAGGIILIVLFITFNAIL